MPNYSINDGQRSSPLRFGSEPTEIKLCSAADTVKAAYRQILKREAEFPGCEPYVRALKGGSRNVRGVVRELLQSEEWKMRFINGRTLPEILVALYSCALARAPDRTGWNDFMAWGTRENWASVIDELVNGSEYTQRFGDDTLPGQGCRYISKSSSSGFTS